MLPGLWQIIFSLGIFASCRFLPRTIAAAGIWYMLTGLGCLALAGSQSLSWWTMGVSFGAGQLLCAAILFFATPEAEDEI
jgi:cyanate permease